MPDSLARDPLATLPYCAWCAGPLPHPERATFCGRRCRQAAWRFRRRRPTGELPVATSPATFAYADPPYPATAAKFYLREPTPAGELAHAGVVQYLNFRYSA